MMKEDINFNLEFQVVFGGGGKTPPGGPPPLCSPMVLKELFVLRPIIEMGRICVTVATCHFSLLKMLQIKKP